MVATRSRTLNSHSELSITNFKSFFNRHDNVYLYVPNIIGYARILFALYAFAVALHDPKLCCIAYFISFVCDELDGRAARSFNQTSTLGAVLDMVTDRIATSCLLAILCILYPHVHILFLSILMLDIFSHWFQMYASLASGSITHKDINSSSFIVRFYYKHRLFMGFCCICVEVFLLAVYLLFWPDYKSWAVIKTPIWMVEESNFRLSESIPGLVVVVVAALPGAAIKQLINVVQLRAAMRQLVDLDNSTRR